MFQLLQQPPCEHRATPGWPRRAVLCAGLLGGCTLAPDQDHNGTDAPTSSALPRPPRTAWVFSSGGPRALVHVGVIKALDELGLVPDLIVGSSAGALMAVLRGAGMSARAIEDVALDFYPWQLARLTAPPWGDGPWLGGGGIADLVRQHLSTPQGIAGMHAPPLERLPVMVGCVSQRLADRAAVVFTRGDAALAVQAACAIEGQFTPLRIRGQRYADADLVQPLPVRVARQLGATRVLAVDASAHEDKAPADAASYRAADLRKRELTRPDARAADVLLHPDFGYWAGMSRAYRERAIAAGYRDAMASEKALRALHAA
jgi:NTE family protein